MFKRNNILIFDRIKQVRKALGFDSQNSFAEELEMKSRTYQTYEQGSVNSIPHTFLCLLNEQYNVSLIWLMTGKGEMFISSKENTNESLNKDFGLDETIANLKLLSKKQQEYYYHKIKADLLQKELQENTDF